MSEAMLTAFSWVPAGAMRSVPLRNMDLEEEAKAAMKQRYADDDDAAAADDDAHNISEDEADEDEARLYGHGAGNIVEQLESDDDDDIDDTTFKDTDLVFACGRASDDPALELYVYDEPKNHIYVHHDFPIMAFPLSLAWMSDGNQSLMAVGTMHPYIEVWSLDVIDPVSPLVVLGGCTDPAKNYKRKVRKADLDPSSHTDAITTMKWNVGAQHILASGSADGGIKFWNLLQGTCLGTFTEDARVQTVDWHHEEPNLLLSCAGGAAKIRDCRQPNAQAMSWAVDNDAFECVRWSRHSASVFGSTTNGAICCYEARMGGACEWRVADRHGGECVIDVSTHVPVLASAGKDGHVALWDIRGCPTEPMSNHNVKLGHTFALQFHPNSPHIVGGCGAKGKPLVYTITDDVEPHGISVTAK